MDNTNHYSRIVLLFIVWGIFIYIMWIPVGMISHGGNSGWGALYLFNFVYGIAAFLLTDKWLE